MFSPGFASWGAWLWVVGTLLTLIIFLAFPFLDANAGQVSDGRRAERPQAKDHPLPAR